MINDDAWKIRYVLAVAVIGCAYTLLQLPFAAVSIARGKRTIGGTVAVALVLVFADVVFALLLATGAAAGFGFTYDVKRNLDRLFDNAAGTPEADKAHRDMDRFFEMAYASAGLLLVAAAVMSLITMLSVYSLAK